MPRFNPLVETLAAPPIPSVFAWADAYDGRNGPMLDFSQAVPGYPPHPEMLRLLGEYAASRAYTGYGPIEGEGTRCVRPMRRMSPTLTARPFPPATSM